MDFNLARKIDGDISREKKKRFNKGPKKGMNRYKNKKNKKDNGNKRLRVKNRHNGIDENGLKFVMFPGTYSAYSDISARSNTQPIYRY